MVNVVMVLLSLVLPLVHLPITKGPWRIGHSVRPGKAGQRGWEVARPS